MRHAQMVDKQLIRIYGVASHLLDQFDGNRAAVHRSEEQRHAFGLFRTLRQWSRTRENEDTVRMLRVTAPDLATVDYPGVAVAHRSSLDLGGIATNVRLSD